jgi:hypothetical protein
MSDEREIARVALEAARAEMVRRLVALRLRTSVADRQLLAVDNDAQTGWQSDWERAPQFVHRSRHPDCGG